MNNIAIRVENLGKMYHIGDTQESYRTFRDAIVRTAFAPLQRAHDLFYGKAASDLRKEVWALKDLTFEIKHGEAVGIIGRNGAGKSTLLKILSRITEPTTGHADVYGRIGALLEVGTGFHPELTGRENIYLNGAILGMSRHDIGRRFEEIVDFSGVEKFIDTPVKHYSSGMGLRLGFAVAAHLESDILIIDEVLAVGDAEFQKKCMGKMSDAANEGRTVLFVSHNMSAVRHLCNRCILINSGRFLASGPTEDIISQYLVNLNHPIYHDLRERKDRIGNGAFRWSKFTIRDKHHELTDLVFPNDPVYFELTYQATQPVQLEHLEVAVVITDAFNTPLFTVSNLFSGEQFEGFSSEGTFVCSVVNLPLTKGTYHINLYAGLAGTHIDWIINAGVFSVADHNYFRTSKMPEANFHGPLLVDHSWEHQSSHEYNAPESYIS